MPQDTVHRFLESFSGRKLKIKFNENRSTMLSVRWEPDYVKVSMHRMFLHAPRNVMEELACYIRKENRSLGREVKRFIDEKIGTLDYSDTVDQKQLITQGDTYDLNALYQKVNREHFEGKLDLKITWFGRTEKKRCYQVNLGLYQSLLKLIKIHKKLDHPLVPEYVVESVVHHEMLHYVHPPAYDERGVHRIHTTPFCESERKFQKYEQSKQWIKENKKFLFGD